jgi:hypothetical protein
MQALPQQAMSATPELPAPPSGKAQGVNGAVPGAQLVGMQLPSRQGEPAGQALPQLPQLFESSASSVHAPPQQLNGGVPVPLHCA